MGRKHDPKDRTEGAFSAIKKFWEERNMSPTLRELGAEIGVKSTSLVLFYVEKLENEGKITRNKNKQRNIRIVASQKQKPTPSYRGKMLVTPSESKIIQVPSFGPIAAGIPIFLPDASFKGMKNPNKDYPDTTIQIPENYLPQGVNVSDVFALYVQGDSMRDAMLTDGDIVILQRSSNFKNGDIVVAWLINDQETTLKRIRFTKRGIWLDPENPNYIKRFCLPDEVDIQGKLLAVLRFRY